MFITERYSNRELELINLIESGAPLWLPNPDNIPQMIAYLNDATVIGYGGGAGGGKTDLMIGMALNQHQKSMIVREEGTQMTSIVDRIGEILGTRDGYNGQSNIWRLPRRGQQIEFGSLPDPNSEVKYMGRPHDFLGFDEVTNILVRQIRYLMTWLRSTTPGQVCQAVLTFNPPTTAAGRWVLDYFRAWLTELTANPGDLRYYVTVAERDIEVPNQPCVLVKDEPVFDFDPKDYRNTDIILPQSRTFIPARVSDNSYLGREYMSMLQALPEPLRSMMLNGDFMKGVEDDAFQVIPSAWVKIAQDRWRLPDKLAEMDSLGVDIARGGRDNSILYPRHGQWYNRAIVAAGPQTPDGPAVVGLVVQNLRDRAPVHIDVVGVGASPYDFLRYSHFQVVGVNVGEKCNETDKSGRLGFVNLKSYLWWHMREQLDPANNTGICLPPDEQLAKDLTAPIYSMQGWKIKVEGRDEIIKRIGRSPDWGSALVLASMETPKIAEWMRGRKQNSGEYDPLAIVR